MIKFIATILAFCLILTRFYLIYKVLYWLFTNFEDPNLKSIQWFLCAILLDLYVSSMEKSYNVDIYKEKPNE
jgi:hypothetical protein